MTKQIGCKGKDVRFVPCLKCLHNQHPQECYKIRKEGNLVIVFRQVIKMKIEIRLYKVCDAGMYEIRTLDLGIPQNLLLVFFDGNMIFEF